MGPLRHVLARATNDYLLVLRNGSKIARQPRRQRRLAPSPPHAPPRRFAKDIVRMQAGVRRREWDGGFTVGELRGATLGVVGYGRAFSARVRSRRDAP